MQKVRGEGLVVLDKLAEKKWMYALYKTERGYVLSVLCGSSAMYELNIPLSDGDADKALSNGAYLDSLAMEISLNPHVYFSKSISI